MSFTFFIKKTPCLICWKQISKRKLRLFKWDFLSEFGNVLSIQVCVGASYILSLSMACTELQVKRKYVMMHAGNFHLYIRRFSAVLEIVLGRSRIAETQATKTGRRQRRRWRGRHRKRGNETPKYGCRKRSSQGFEAQITERHLRPPGVELHFIDDPVNFIDYPIDYNLNSTFNHPLILIFIFINLTYNIYYRLSLYKNFSVD